MVASTVKNGNDRKEREMDRDPLPFIVNNYGGESDAKTKHL